MKVQDAINKMKTKNLIDDREIYVYASKKSLLGGAAGAIAGLTILSVYECFLYIHKANVDNSRGEFIEKISIADMRLLKAKAGLFGGSFIFEHNGKKYNYQLPSRANKFVEFFIKK